MKKKLTLPIFRVDGSHDDTVELPSLWFNRPVSAAFLAQAMRVYQSNLRQGTVKTRDRSDVHRTKAKVYRQKGTGRARHGARSAPIFVGGGVTHGPDGTQNFRMKMSPVMKNRALAGALTQKLINKKITCVMGIGSMKGKTKEAVQWIKNLNLEAAKRIVLVMDKVDIKILNSTANVQQLMITRVRRTNAWEVMQASHLLITPEAVEYWKAKGIK